MKKFKVAGSRGRGPGTQGGNPPAQKPPSRRIRRSQAVSPFGVGAIYDVLGESFVAMDTLAWGNSGERIELDRLARSLRVDHFRLPPAARQFPASTGPGMPFYRFPEWLFCTRCRRLDRYERAHLDRVPVCSQCPGGSKLVPVRFVMACRKGHLGDVDWHRWAHSSPHTADQRQCQIRDLRWETAGDAGGGLRSVVVKCRRCGAHRSLEGIMGEHALERVGIHCTGPQPWQPWTHQCPERPMVLQRGATNLHYARIASALDIPPGSKWRPGRDERRTVMTAPEFEVLVSTVGDPDYLSALYRTIADRTGLDLGMVKQIVAQERARREGVAPSGGDEASLEEGEWNAFYTDSSDTDARDHFITRRVGVVPENWILPDTIVAELQRLVDRVVMATRLREVRALVGFSRIEPPGDDATLVPPDLDGKLNWLPAIEVFGEGVFISFREDAIASWEQRADVRARVKALTERLPGAPHRSWLPPPTARYVMLHTLAHLLIRRLTFECGYSSSSLRERLYVTADGTADMAGILIYTAAADSEGSLGGLARQGEPPRLAATLLAALQDAAWCSGDPICGEVHSGPSGLNRAACHACALVAETSCVSSNLLLDRGLVGGGPGVHGFLGDLLRFSLDAVE